MSIYKWFWSSKLIENIKVWRWINEYFSFVADRYVVIYLLLISSRIHDLNLYCSLLKWRGAVGKEAFATKKHPTIAPLADVIVRATNKRTGRDKTAVSVGPSQMLSAHCPRYLFLQSASTLQRKWSRYSSCFLVLSWYLRNIPERTHHPSTRRRCTQKVTIPMHFCPGKNHPSRLSVTSPSIGMTKKEITQNSMEDQPLWIQRATFSVAREDNSCPVWWRISWQDQQGAVRLVLTAYRRFVSHLLLKLHAF